MTRSTNDQTTTVCGLFFGFSSELAIFFMVRSRSIVVLTLYLVIPVRVITILHDPQSHISMPLRPRTSILTTARGHQRSTTHKQLYPYRYIQQCRSSSTVVLVVFVFKSTIHPRQQYRQYDSFTMLGNSS